MIVGWIVLPVIAFLYLRFGYVPVAVDGPVIPFEELLAGAAVQARIAREAPQARVFQPVSKTSSRAPKFIASVASNVMDCRAERRQRSRKACTRRLRNSLSAR